jgi:signal transduction histidine kinase
LSKMTNSRELDCRIEKFLLVRANLPLMLAGTVVTALAFFVLLEKDLSTQVRVSWFTFVVVITAIRAAFLRFWYINETTRENVNRRIVIASVMGFLLSGAFGFYGYIGISESNVFSTLPILMILTGLIAGATGTTAFILPMFIVIVMPLMLPVTVKMFGFEQEFYQWVSVLTLVYLIICTAAAQIVNASVAQSIDMRFDNQDLLENLQLEKHRAEEALRREARANQAKSKFLAAASHDLRQPLHSLRLFTATLELQTRDTRHKTLVSQIDTSVKSLEELFNALLDISRLDAGTLTVNKQHVQLYCFLLQLQSDFLPLAAEKGIDFVCEVEECVVFTDLVLLERLIRNLISNAIRYTSTGTVTLSTERQDECVSISVMDTGPGISTENQTRVFDEFVQLNSGQVSSGEGLGLGLSIVKRLATLLDVSIVLVSQPGLGAVFSVKVPYGQPGSAVGAQREVNYVDDDVDNYFILIIDDEPDVCLAVEGLLETWGCIVMTAVSGDAAVTQLEEIGEIPDVIISDYQLCNNETGGAAIQRVRNYVGQKIPAIILTGDIAPERLLAIKKLGLPMLHKPCEPDALRKLLAQEASASGSQTA